MVIHPLYLFSVECFLPNHHHPMVDLDSGMTIHPLCEESDTIYTLYRKSDILHNGHPDFPFLFFLYVSIVYSFPPPFFTFLSLDNYIFQAPL